MNNLKKVLALVVAVAMLASFGFVASAADFSDVASNANYADAVNLLSNLGIINGYEDGTFRPDNTITRAEVAAIMVRMLGAEDSVEPGATVFTDVPADNWASGYINEAQARGIIDGMGDGTFAPNAEVTYEQVVKMLVCALGYEPAAAANGGYPTGYLYYASRIGVTKGVSGTTGQAASRATVAKLVYNSLEIDLMDQKSFSTGLYGINFEVQEGKTILTEYLELEKVDAVVVDTYLSNSDYEDGNDKASLVITKNYASADVKVDYEVSEVPQKFVADNTDAATLLGYSVVAYVGENEDGDDEIFAIAEKAGKNTLTVLDTDDIVELKVVTNNKSGEDETIVEYYKTSSSRSTSTANIDYTIANKDFDADFDATGYNVVVNGFNNADYATGVKFDLFTNYKDIDDVTFLDNDGDGDFEFIFVNFFTTDGVEFVVDSIDLEDYYLEGVDNTGSLVIDNDNADVLYTVVKDGRIADFADIEEGDVVTVLDDSNTTSVKTIYVSSTVVEGTIDEVEDDDKFAISGTQYKVSPYALALGNIKYDEEAGGKRTAKLAAGDEGIYYINYLGKIAYVDTINSISGADYVYIINADTSTGDFNDSSEIIKVVNAQGAVQVLTIKSKKVDVYGDNGLVLEDVEDDAANNEIKAYLAANPRGGIAKLDTNAAGEVTAIYFPGADDFDYQDRYADDATTKDREYSEVKSTYGTITLKADTVVFNVDSGEEDLEDAVTASTVGNLFVDGSSYSFIAYGEDVSDEAEAIVTTDAKTAFDPEAPVMVVTAKTKVVSDDDETTYKITGVMGGETVSVIVDPDESSDADDVVKGNIIIFSKSASGFAQDVAVLFDSTEDNAIGTVAGVTGDISTNVAEKDIVNVAFGKIVDKGTNSFELEGINDDKGDAISYMAASGCNYISVEKSGKSINVKSAGSSIVRKSTDAASYYAFVKTTEDEIDEVTDVVVFKSFD